MFIKQNTAQKASTLAGYVAAYKIAKNNKPYSEGEFVKDCMVSMGKISCPEKIKICEQTFSTMKLRKNSIRNRLTDEHLFALLKVASSQLKPAFENIMENQKRFHMSHTPNKAEPSNKS
ncbi:proteinral transcription factor ii-i repeat domain-containing protein 2a [Nephila pilipes]|uniref:Proteinral transcription factor ii-i repeat domain-containing protein 2a n=1 Tax=Nephila pilipes TaxID=299642 RepID=A0A8X6PV36_NEPPI|nr:proteinral transcription factor ii-i repeat domain-containing protein 2a [Nephila pilipes]